MNFNKFYEAGIHKDVCEFIIFMVEENDFPMPTIEMAKEFDNGYRISKDTMDVWYQFDHEKWGLVNWAKLKIK